MYYIISKNNISLRIILFSIIYFSKWYEYIKEVTYISVVVIDNEIYRGATSETSF